MSEFSFDNLQLSNFKTPDINDIELQLIKKNSLAGNPDSEIQPESNLDALELLANQNKMFFQKNLDDIHKQMNNNAGSHLNYYS